MINNPNPNTFQKYQGYIYIFHYTKIKKIKITLETTLICTHTQRLKLKKKNPNFIKIHFNVQNVVRTPSVVKKKRGSFNFGKFQIFSYTIGIFFLVKFYIKIIFFSLIFVLKFFFGATIALQEN